MVGVGYANGEGYWGGGRGARNTSTFKHAQCYANTTTTTSQNNHTSLLPNPPKRHQTQGANFGPGLMTRFGIKDTIARGLAAAGTAGGLGTASLTSKEPEALPFCALSYALVGIFSTVIMAVPAVQAAALAIVG